MTHKEIIAECRRILNKTTPKSAVTPQEFSFLVSVFSKVPYWQDKTLGLDIVNIHKNTGSYGTYCFWLERSDGTMVDFSFSKMFACSKHADIISALRNAIDPIILEMRENFIPFTYNGINVTNPTNAVVHHEDLTFQELAKVWIEQHGGEDAIHKKIKRTTCGDTFLYIADKELKNDFINFHNKNTHLVWLPTSIHQELHKHGQ